MAIFDISYIGDLPYLKLSGGIITGATTFNGGITASTINGVAVGSSPKFTDTVTTVTTSGSGNVVTAVSASNGAITVTKGNVQPVVTYSTTDLTAGSSSLTTGQVYLVYE